MNQKKRVGTFVRKGLRLLWRMAVIVLQVAAAFASEKPSKPRFTPNQAQEFFDEGLIGIAEYNESISGDKHL
ncbi:MAG: hypothetical protein H0U57_13175 [Tatlockia sp.]|nr:hypothetical protein [Tatlockia sp.]